MTANNCPCDTSRVRGGLLRHWPWSPDQCPLAGWHGRPGAAAEYGEYGTRGVGVGVDVPAGPCGERTTPKSGGAGTATTGPTAMAPSGAFTAPGRGVARPRAQ